MMAEASELQSHLYVTIPFAYERLAFEGIPISFDPTAEQIFNLRNHVTTRNVMGLLQSATSAAAKSLHLRYQP